MSSRAGLSVVAIVACGVAIAPVALADTSCTGSQARIALDSGSVASEATAYAARFDTGSLGGNIVARAVETNAQTGGASWSAEAQMPAPDARTIVARVDANNGFGNGQTRVVALDSTDDDVLAACETENENASADDCEHWLDYIRGDHSHEQANGGTLRDRDGHLLGAIVHSDPAYVGAPRRLRYPDNWDDRLSSGDQDTIEDKAGTYRSFASQNQARTPMVYVGANDGMLHGFDATNGAEKIAYVPHAVFDRLATLTAPEPGLAGNTEPPDDGFGYYVDASPATGDVVYDGGWHTVLVAPLGRGGKGVTALDITDPADFSQADTGQRALWGFDDDDLGYIAGKPSLVRLHNGQWAAMFGNGYASDHRATVLYLVAIGSGQCIAKLSVYGGSTSCAATAADAPTAASGLSQPFPVDLDGDFITDYVYAGDLRGNIWRFDLTAASPDQWGHPKRIFTARNGAGERQPITAAPRVAAHIDGLDYGVMVYVGTGQPRDLDAVNPSPPSDNAFYGVWDPGVFTSADTVTPASPAAPDELIDQHVAATSGEYRAVTAHPIAAPRHQTTAELEADPITPQDFDRGWRLALPRIGEKVIAAARLARRTVSFETVVPADPTGGDNGILDPPACGNGGHSFLMVVNRATGSRTRMPAFDVDGDGDFSPDGDSIASGTQEIPVSGRKLDYGLFTAAAHVTNQETGRAFFIVPKPGGATATIETYLFDRNRRVTWRALRR